MKPFVIVAGLALFAFPAFAQSVLPGRAAAEPPLAKTWFKPADMMTVGVYYYPEAWPESQWERDIGNIRTFGFEFIHMGEFAWYFMEPEEGKFQFEWLEKNVKLAAAKGLKVILCTPSPTPPIWLVRKHPEVLMVNARGQRVNHGGREHADWSHPLYRQYVSKIVTELAKRFGNNPAVWGWQIDNELSHYGQYSYSPASRDAFRLWLREKYGTIDKLNRDWGNSFWSQMYQNFDQIDIPNPAELVAQENPHAMLDFQRWFASDSADYIRMQAALLRKYTKSQWITTNYMGLFKDVDPTRSVGDLDVFTWTHYPVHGNLNEGPLGFRLGDPYVMSFNHDLYRSFNGLSGLMELQTGQVNWGSVNPLPLPGAVRMWVLRAFGAGANLVNTYRYRQPLSGSELFHKGIVETDGVTLSPGGKEYVQAIQDVNAARKLYKAGAIPPPDYEARRTAFLVSWDDRWDIDNHKQNIRWNTDAHWMRYYRALKSMAAPVDVMAPTRDYSRYRFVVAPAWEMARPEQMRAVLEYARKGGHVILTCRSGLKDERGHLWEGPWAQPLLDVIGAKIPFYDVLPSPVQGTVRFEDKTYAWATWGDILQPYEGTTVLATYADQFYAGRPAAVTRKVGQGSVTYVGVDSLDGELERAILQRVYTDAGVKPATLAPGFIVDWRDGFWVATNFTDKPHSIPANANVRFVRGSRDVAPGAATIWMQ